MMEFSFYDTFFSSIFWSTGSFGIGLNLYLIYLILKKSPPSLNVYRVFVLNVALSDLVFSASTTFSQIRLIPNKWAFAYVPLGPARHFRPHVGYYGYCIMLHSLFYMFLCFPISFGFRYYILIRPVPAVKSCVIMSFCLWLVALGQHILFLYSESPPDEIMKYLLLNKPQYNLTVAGWPVSGNNMTTEHLTVVTLCSIVLPMFPIYALVLYFYFKVHKYLDQNATDMRPGTINGHRRLIQALTIQAALPVLFVFPPISIYMLYHLEFIQFTVIEYLVYTLFSFMPVASPLVTMYFIRPYNVAIKRLFRMRIDGPATSMSQIAVEKNTRFSSLAG